MFRRAGMVCAGALLWVAAGCTPSSFLAPEPETYVATGSVGVVSAILQARLATAGIAVIAKREAGATRLVGETGSKKTFAVCLRPAKDKPGDKTMVSLLWAGEPDIQVWQTILTALKPPASLPASDTRRADPPASGGKPPTAGGPAAE